MKVDLPGIFEPRGLESHKKIYIKGLMVKKKPKNDVNRTAKPCTFIIAHFA